jgi:hypothetical protein
MQAVLTKHVNLVDLVQGDKMEVEIFETEKDLSEYTIQTNKFFPKEDAADGGVLRALRRRIFSPRGPVSKGDLDEPDSSSTADFLQVGVPPPEHENCERNYSVSGSGFVSVSHPVTFSIPRPLSPRWFGYLGLRSLTSDYIIMPSTPVLVLPCNPSVCPSSVHVYLAIFLHLPLQHLDSFVSQLSGVCLCVLTLGQSFRTASLITRLSHVSNPLS